MTYRKVVFAIIFLFVFLHSLLGQEQEETRSLLYFVDVSPEEPAAPEVTSALINRVLEEVILLNFTVEGDPVSVYRGVSSEDTSERDFRLDAYFVDLLDSDADIIISTFYSIQGSNIFVQYILYDPLTEVGVGGGAAQARVGVTLFSSINEAVLSLRIYLEDYLENRYAFQAAVGRVESITVTGEQEGVEIFLANRYVGNITSGDLIVPFTPLPIGSLFELELRKQGYHTQSFNINVEDPNILIELPNLWREKRFAVQAYWTLGFTRGIGLSAKTYLIPDNTFLQFGFHFHESSYSLQDIEIDPAISTVASPTLPQHNQDFSFLIGQYIIFPPEFFIRLSIGLGLGVIKTTIISDTLIIEDFNDVYVNIGNPTIEFNFGDLQIFIRGEFKYLLGLSNNLLGLNWLETTLRFPPISIGLQIQW